MREVRVQVEVVLEYEGKQYTVTQEYDSIEGVEFMWTDGNYSCDCNRALFIRETNPTFPELECGNEIDLVSLVHS